MATVLLEGLVGVVSGCFQGCLGCLEVFSVFFRALYAIARALYRDRDARA